AGESLGDEVGEHVPGNARGGGTREQGVDRREVVRVVDDEPRQQPGPAVPDLDETRTTPINAFAQVERLTPGLDDLLGVGLADDGARRADVVEALPDLEILTGPEGPVDDDAPARALAEQDQDPDQEMPVHPAGQVDRTAEVDSTHSLL